MSFTRKGFEECLKKLTNHDWNVLLRKVGKYQGDIYILNKQQMIDIYNHIKKLEKQGYFSNNYRVMIKSEYYKGIKDFIPPTKNERFVQRNYKKIGKP